MRRRPGHLLPIEQRILAAMARPGGGSDPLEIHGFALASAMADGSRARVLTSHGTLYKALRRLEDLGLLSSRWEEADRALAEGRPRRRLYRLSSRGREVAAAVGRAAATRSDRVRIPALGT